MTASKQQGDFFVILNTQLGGITPLVDSDGELATFASLENARHGADNSVLGEAFGYEVFERGMGEIA
jgi:hypothetical protein|tara:strand:- start:402 stop:602 length:201 start_codon:yes stop_codon:yes gene_type:complete